MGKHGLKSKVKAVSIEEENLTLKILILQCEGFASLHTTTNYYLYTLSWRPGLPGPAPGSRRPDINLVYTDNSRCV